MKYPQIALATALGCIVSTPAVAERRYQLVAIDNESIIMVDDATVKRSGNLAVFWAAMIERDTDWDYSMLRSEIDCAADNMRNTFSAVYQNGDLVSSYSSDEAFQPVIPATTGETILNYVCTDVLDESIERNLFDPKDFAEMKVWLRENQE